MVASELTQRLQKAAAHAAKLSQRYDLLVTISLRDYGYCIMVQREAIGFEGDIVRLHKHITWEAADQAADLAIPNVLTLAIDHMVQQVDQE